MKIGKLKKSQQRGGVKASIKTTGNVFVPTVNSKLIISRLFSNCDTVRLLSSGSSGFAFIMHLKPDSTINLRSQTLDDGGNPLTQLDAADRERNATTGLLMENCCVKISLVETSGTQSGTPIVYNNIKKLAVSQEEATEEVKNQKKMHRTSMSGTGVHGVFIPGVITHDIMNATEFETLARKLKPRGADDTLIWIIGSARKYKCNIQVFCMELIAPDAPHAFTTFREFKKTDAAANPSTQFPPTTVEVACKTATAVISTFTKSSFWSYDTHGTNIMTNGIFVYLLDFGRIYNIIDSKFEIDNLLEKMLLDQSPLHKARLLQFFGLSPGVSDDEIKAAFNAIYNRYADIDRSVITELFTINPSQDDDDISRVRSNIFEILALFALIDGMTNKYKYKYTTPGLQCREYMYFIFRTSFSTLDLFLERCSSTLDGFITVCTTLTLVPAINVGEVVSNLDAIAHLLQGALVPSAAMGPARQPGEFDLPNSDVDLSEDEVTYRNIRDKLMEDEDLARKRDAAKQEKTPGDILGDDANHQQPKRSKYDLYDLYGGTIKFQVRRKRQRTRRRSYHRTRRRLRRGGNTSVKI